MWPGGLCIRDGVQAICVQLSVKNRLFPLAVQATQMCIKQSDCSSQDKSASGTSYNIQKSAFLLREEIYKSMFFIHPYLCISAYLLFC